jgi:hypothetical protein
VNAKVLITIVGAEPGLELAPTIHALPALAAVVLSYPSAAQAVLSGDVVSAIEGSWIGSPSGAVTTLEIWVQVALASLMLARPMIVSLGSERSVPMYQIERSGAEATGWVPRGE